jgi:F-type H+-transporting ATPase subunit delta
MVDQAIVSGYAQAILAAAKAEGALDRVEDELFRLARSIQGSGELSQRLSDPGADVATKADLAVELLAGRAHPQTVAAVVFVLQAGHGRQLLEIADEAVRLAAQERSTAIAEVHSAVPLDDNQRQRLAEALQRSTGQTVDIKVVVDPDVVGGLNVRIGDTVIDGSVARRLTELKARLTGA